MKKLNCLNCNREFDKEQGHLCPKSRWTWENENVSKILENTDVDIDLRSYEFITPPNEPLPETSSFCTEVLNEISDPSADYNLSTKLSTGANRQTSSKCLENSDTCDNPTVSDIHAVPGPSRLSFYESEGSVSEEECESKQDPGLPNNEKSWTCKVCQRVFKQKRYLKQHMKIHDGEKKHRCNDCGKSFLRNSTLKNHRMRHTGERPFSCPACGKRFNRNSALKIHMLTHRPKELFKCEFCDESYARESDLKMHVMIHTGEKPFTCTVCGRGFKRKSNFKRHTNLHNGDKYPCEFCEKEFTQMRSLKVHVRKHTHSEKYKCDICGKRYLQKRSLKNHEKIHQLN